MTRRRKQRTLLVPEARTYMPLFQQQVMQREGIQSSSPEDVKYEVAQQLGIPLNHGDNGNLTTEDAGRIGGKIGGATVRDLIKLAQSSLNSTNRE